MKNIKDNLKANAIIYGPLFHEQVKVIVVVPMGDVIKLVGCFFISPSVGKKVQIYLNRRRYLNPIDNF